MESLPRSHLQMLNTSAPGPEEQQSAFSLFPELPSEIRLQVWRLALQQQPRRIIRVRLLGNWLMDQVLAGEGQSTAYAGKGRRYCVVAEGRHVHSRLLRVSGEARAAALAHYRVHLPCRLSRDLHGFSGSRPGLLYLDPERDFLHIKSDQTGYAPAFLRDLRARHDRSRVGLLNLVVDLNSLTGSHGLTLRQDDDPSSPPSPEDLETAAAVRDTLRQLRAVYFLGAVTAGRQNYNYLSGHEVAEAFFNRSVPIMATAAPAFDIVPRDPRPQVAADLRGVYVGKSDPREMIQAWWRTLERWGAASLPGAGSGSGAAGDGGDTSGNSNNSGSEHHRTEYRYMVASEPFCAGIHDREGARQWLQKEDDIWTGAEVYRHPDKYSDHCRRQTPGAQKLQEDLQRAARPAFGFWLFPIDAFGPVEPGREYRYMPRRLLDLSDHWPELALSSLP